MKDEEIIAELYGAMWVFRCLGFISDNLYVAFGIIATAGPFEGDKCVGVQLRHRGKEFNFYVAPVKNDKKFGAKWTHFCEEANNGPPDDLKLKKMVDESFCRMNVATLIIALHAKDIHPPLDSN